MNFGRERNRDERVYDPIYYQDLYPGGAEGVSGVHTALTRGGYTESIKDSSTPNYWERRASGEIILNDLELTERTYTCSDDTVTIGEHPNWGSRVFTGPFSSLWMKSHGLGEIPDGHQLKINIATETVLLKATSKAKAATAETLVELAEFHKTLSMLRKPLASAKRLSQQFRDRRAYYEKQIRRGLKAKRAKLSKLQSLKALSSTWMELRFGWRPLYYGIRDFIEAMEKLKRPDSGVLVARSGVVVTDEDTLPVSEFHHNGDLTGLACTSYRTKVTAGVIYKVVDENYAKFASQLFGLRARDLPGTAWELTRLSWLVDMFVKVGDWLDAIVPDPNIIVLGNWVTVATTAHRRYTNGKYAVYIGTAPAGTYEAPFSDFIETYRITTRTVNNELSAVPMPNLNTFDYRQYADVVGVLLGGIDTKRMRI